MSIDATDPRCVDDVPRWLFAVPGSTITIEESGPHYVTRASYEAARERVNARL